MVDKDRDGIEDSKDIDGGTGTNKAPTPNSDSQDAAILASIAPFLAQLMSQGADGPTSTAQSGTQTSVTRLTYNSAKALLETAMAEAGFAGKLSADDIKNFMEKFKTAQDKQIEKIVTSAKTKIVPGATPEATKKVVESVTREEFPSFFKPTDFAKDFIFAKIDFKNEATLGAKQLDALSKVRGMADKFQLLGVSDADMRVAAKQIAMGKKTIEEYTIELQKIAKKEYPQFAERFDLDATLTISDIASPIVKLLAKTWQKTEKEVQNHPLVKSWINYPGPDGKGKQPSYYDIELKAKNDPLYDLTEEANESARNAAVGFARAIGFGV
jgi:hypothetical protein